MGAMFQGPDAPPRARYSMRLRRAVPALTLLLVLAVAAGMVWLRVLDRVDGGGRAAAAACGVSSSPARPQVRVYNATAREGLARTVAGQLVSRGFAVLATENDPLAGVRQVEGPAEIRFGAGGCPARRSTGTPARARWRTWCWVRSSAGWPPLPSWPAAGRGSPRPRPSRHRSPPRAADARSWRSPWPILVPGAGVSRARPPAGPD